MTKPIAVLISDIHFNINTLEIATQALKLADQKSRELCVPLVIAGDLNDTKAILRGEVANRLINIFSQHRAIKPIIIVGNHDLINEKRDEHCLNFLRPYAHVIAHTTWCEELNSYLVPYMSNSEELLEFLKSRKPGSRIIMHQGVQTAFMGHYMQDKTSLPPSAFDGFRVISGHYHRAQDIKCGETGLFSYLGSPYTTTFAEANDGPKGFRILNNDGSLDFVPTNLRKHIIEERTLETLYNPVTDYIEGDLVWVKVVGPKSELNGLNKIEIGNKLFGHANFKLEKIPNDSQKIDKSSLSNLTDGDILDQLIDGLSENDYQKGLLKALWREVYATTDSKD